jgi:hypothetical protein
MDFAKTQEKSDFCFNICCSEYYLLIQRVEKIKTAYRKSKLCEGGWSVTCESSARESVLVRCKIRYVGFFCFFCFPPSPRLVPPCAKVASSFGEKAVPPSNSIHDFFKKTRKSMNKFLLNKTAGGGWLYGTDRITRSIEW